jgi:hypothetical protein
MRSHRALYFAVAAACATASCTHGATSTSTRTIVGHAVRVDASGRLLSWSTAQAPYERVAQLAWTALETKFAAKDGGLETWLSSSRFDPVTLEGVNWPHNPASLYAMLTDSAVLWYAFSGDRSAVDLVRKALDYQIDHGTTRGTWAWASVPFASSNAGDLEYGGADDAWCDFCGRGDGVGVIEPDKVGELGFAYLQMFEMTGDGRYREAAVACANALANHVRAGDEQRSPWPFRVYAQSNVVREEYSSNVVGTLMLFDELRRLSLGNLAACARARDLAFEWLVRVPMNNDAWSGYFEDIEIQHDPSANPNQYAALRTARWLLGHPESDSRWRAHVAHLLAWVVKLFGHDTDTESGSQWGAVVMSEQAADMAKMGSHTARYGATLALWSEATGDRDARQRAARSLNWATYTCGEDGIVAVGENTAEGWWFSDGYGDYIRHFLLAMAAVPEWAPAGRDHLLRSTSIVTWVGYAPGRVSYRTFDADSTETLRLRSRPRRVVVGGTILAERADIVDEGYRVREVASGDPIVLLHHRSRGDVVVEY